MMREPNYVDRGLFENAVQDSFWQGLQGSVADGTFTQGQADTILALFPHTPAFRQAVDSAIRRTLEALDQ